MPKLGLSLTIDVTKIDKSKLYVGKKGKYLSMTCFIDTEEKDKYGNHGRIDEGQTKEERQQGVKPAILGNAKIFWTDGTAPNPANGSTGHSGTYQQPAQYAKQGEQEYTDLNDEIPF